MVYQSTVSIRARSISHRATFLPVDKGNKEDAIYSPATRVDRFVRIPSNIPRE